MGNRTVIHKFSASTPTLLFGRQNQKKLLDNVLRAEFRQQMISRNHAELLLENGKAHCQNVGTHPLNIDGNMIPKGARAPVISGSIVSFLEPEAQQLPGILQVLFHTAR